MGVGGASATPSMDTWSRTSSHDFCDGRPLHGPCRLEALWHLVEACRGLSDADAHVRENGNPVMLR
jgi:hypothetical protein